MLKILFQKSKMQSDLNNPIVTIRPILHRQIFVIKQTGYYIQGQNKINISIVSQPRYAAPTTYSNISNQIE